METTKSHFLNVAGGIQSRTLILQRLVCHVLISGIFAGSQIYYTSFGQVWPQKL